MRRVIDRIREKIRSGQYVLAFHALEEMIEEDFVEEDVEQAMFNGRIVRRQRDGRGRRKYTVEGRAQDGRPVGAVCRFSETGEYIVVITVYEVT